MCREINKKSCNLLTAGCEGLPDVGSLARTLNIYDLLCKPPEIEYLSYRQYTREIHFKQFQVT